MRAERSAAVQRYNECGSQGEHTGCREEAGNKMKRNGVAIRHFQRSSAGPQGRSCTLISDSLLSIWQTQGSLHNW